MHTYALRHVRADLHKVKAADLHKVKAAFFQHIDVLNLSSILVRCVGSLVLSVCVMTRDLKMQLLLAR